MTNPPPPAPPAGPAYPPLPTPPPPPMSRNPRTGLIVGIVVGVVALLVVTGGVVTFLALRLASDRAEASQEFGYVEDLCALIDISPALSVVPDLERMPEMEHDFHNEQAREAGSFCAFGPPIASSFVMADLNIYATADAARASYQFTLDNRMEFGRADDQPSLGAGWDDSREEIDGDWHEAVRGLATNEQGGELSAGVQLVVRDGTLVASLTFMVGGGNAAPAAQESALKQILDDIREQLRSAAAEGR